MGLHGLIFKPDCAAVPMQELFAAMDSNNDGKIDSQDLHNALEKVRRKQGCIAMLSGQAVQNGDTHDIA